MVGHERVEAEEGSRDVRMEIGECPGESIFCALCVDMRGPAVNLDLLSCD
jgi:hypothetical protein